MTGSSRRGSQILANSSSLLMGSILSMAMSVVVVAFASRTYGPEGLGQIYYSVALVSLFTAVATLSMDNVAVNRLVRQGADEGEVLGTAFVLRLGSGAFVVFVATLSAYLIGDQQDRTMWILVLCVSTAMGLRAFDVIDYWVQVHLKAGLFTSVRVTVTLLTSVLKIAVVVLGGNILAYTSLYVVDALLVGLASLVAYRNVRSSGVKWRYRQELAGELLRESVPLIGSGILISVYSRVDQVMIGLMLPGKAYVGLYAAAVALAELWYVVPNAIIISLKATVLGRRQSETHAYDSALGLLFRTVTWSSVLLALIFSVSAPLLINVVYGSEFGDAAGALAILAWAGVLSMIGVARSVWLIAEGLQKYTMIYTGLACTLNVVANLLLIPRFGIYGAAIATLCAQSASILVLSLFRSTRESFRLILVSFSVRELGISIRMVAALLASLWAQHKKLPGVESGERFNEGGFS